MLQLFHSPAFNFVLYQQGQEIEVTDFFRNGLLVADFQSIQSRS